MGIETSVTASVGTAIVRFRLFGDVSEERLTRESELCRHRATQLGYVPAKKKGWASDDARALGTAQGKINEDIEWD